jgi:hypothetical protein
MFSLALSLYSSQQRSSSVAFSRNLCPYDKHFKGTDNIKHQTEIYRSEKAFNKSLETAAVTDNKIFVS